MGRVQDIASGLIAGEEQQAVKYQEAVVAIREKQAKIQEMSTESDLFAAAEFERGKVVGWDEAMAQAEVPAGDKVYTEEQWQQEMVPRDQKIAAQQVEIDNLKMDAELKDAELAAVKAELEALKAAPPVDVEAIKVAAKAEMKADINLALDQFQAQVLA